MRSVTGLTTPSGTQRVRGLIVAHYGDRCAALRLVLVSLVRFARAAVRY